MTQRWNGAGLESVNGSVLSRREKDRLVGPHIKTTKGTHAHTPKASSQIRPSLVPLRDFAQLPLLGRHKPHQGEESGTEPSSCLSWSFVCQGWLCPSGWRGRESCHFLWDRYVGVTCHEPMVVPPKPKVTQKSSSVSCLAGIACHISVLSLSWGLF